MRRAQRFLANGPRHVVVNQFVQACLASQMLRARPQPVARVPPADSKLSTLLVGHEPVVGLLLLVSANVA